MAVDLSRQEDGEPISAINVTPFVDVMLVLLVIFMVTAPAMIKETLSVKLPEVQSGAQTTQPSEPLAIVILRTGEIQMGGKTVTSEELAREAALRAQSSPDTAVVISADAEVKHGEVVQVIDRVKGSGLSRFSIQVERKR